MSCTYPEGARAQPRPTAPRSDGGKHDADRDGPERDGYPAILCEGDYA